MNFVIRRKPNGDEFLEIVGDDVESVSTHYLMEVLREHRRENNYQSLRLLGSIITDDRTWFSNEKVYWVRRAL